MTTSLKYLALLHMFKSVIRLLQRVFLNHTLDILVLCELNRLLAVQCVTTRPAVNGDSLHDQRRRIDRDLADRRQDEEFATGCKAMHEIGDEFGVRCCDDLDGDCQ